MNISGIEIGSGPPCRFVAEIGNAHNGDRDRCGRLIDAAKAAGADFIKTQCYTPDELVALRGDGPAPEPWGSQGWTMRALYEKAATPLEWFPKIAAHCERVGMPWFSSVFGPESLAVLESVGCPAYKIARLDNMQRELAWRVERTGKPVIVSESTPDESRPAHLGLVNLSLYCPPGYPQVAPFFDQVHFVGRFCPDHDDFFDGFSFHGVDPKPCEVAATLGAKIIEAHFTLRDEPSELENNVSLDEYQFAEMIANVRQVEAMLA